MRRYIKKNIVKKDRNVTIRFDQETYDKIEAAARAADLSVSGNCSVPMEVLTT